MVDGRTGKYRTYANGKWNDSCHCLSVLRQTWPTPISISKIATNRIPYTPKSTRICNSKYDPIAEGTLIFSIGFMCAIGDER